jgi:hypothetical protein
VRDEAARRGAITKVRDWALAHGFEVGHPSSAVESSTGSPASDDVDLGPNVVESPITGPAGNVDLGPNVVESPITGPAGNVEYLLLLRTAGAESAPVEPSASS